MPLTKGANTVLLEAYDLGGNAVGSDQIIVTRE